MPVAQTAPAALEQHELLAVGSHLAYDFGRRRSVLVFTDTVSDRTQRNGDHDVFGILARRTGSGTVFAVFGELVTLVLEVDERPILLVALENNTAALAAVTAVGTAERHEFLAAEMHRAASAMPRTGKYFYVIYEVRSCHVYSSFLRCQLSLSPPSASYTSRNPTPNASLGRYLSLAMGMQHCN